LRLVSTSGTGMPFKKGAMRALGRLARSDECAVDMVHAGALPQIVALLKEEEPDATLLRRSLIALYFIGADKPELQVRCWPKHCVTADYSLERVFAVYDPSMLCVA
jgi:hypothetical protein